MTRWPEDAAVRAERGTISCPGIRRVSGWRTWMILRLSWLPTSRPGRRYPTRSSSGSLVLPGAPGNDVSKQLELAARLLLR